MFNTLLVNVNLTKKFAVPFDLIGVIVTKIVVYDKHFIFIIIMRKKEMCLTILKAMSHFKTSQAFLSLLGLYRTVYDLDRFL